MTFRRKHEKTRAGAKPRFVKYRCGALTGSCVEGYEPLDLKAIPWDTLRHQPDPNHELAKRSRTRRVVRMTFTPAGGPPGAVYAKRVRLLSGTRRLGALLSTSKTRHEWDAGYRLAAMGIGTCRPVVFAEHWDGMRLEACYLVTEEIAGARSFLEELDRNRESRRQRRALLVDLARWLWAVHRRGFYHDDCSAEHVFVEATDGGAADASGRARGFLFIDLDNCSFHWLSVPWRRRVKNLFQLLRSIPRHLASPTDRLHFVLAYLEAGGKRRRLRRTVAGMRRHARAKEANIYL